MKTWKFKRYDGVYTRGDTKIGINKSGLIRLSAGFCRMTNALNFKSCVLFYDVENNAIALKLTNSGEAGIFKVTRDTTGATVSGKSFFTANKLDLEKFSGRYDWVKLILPKIGEVFIIELKKNEATS